MFGIWMNKDIDLGLNQNSGYIKHQTSCLIYIQQLLRGIYPAKSFVKYRRVW